MSQGPHDITEFKACSLFNSEHAYHDGYSTAVCTCGWVSAPARTEVALVAMHTAHRNEMLFREREGMFPRTPTKSRPEEIAKLLPAPPSTKKRASR